MKNRIEEVINQVQKSSQITDENRPLILEKIQEWKNEEKVVNDVAIRFENWWLEMQPIFAKLGWI